MCTWPVLRPLCASTCSSVEWDYDRHPPFLVVCETNEHTHVKCLAHSAQLLVILCNPPASLPAFSQGNEVHGGLEPRTQVRRPLNATAVTHARAI